MLGDLRGDDAGRAVGETLGPPPPDVAERARVGCALVVVVVEEEGGAGMSFAAWTVVPGRGLCAGG